MIATPAGLSSLVGGAMALIVAWVHQVNIVLGEMTSHGGYSRRALEHDRFVVRYVICRGDDAPGLVTRHCDHPLAVQGPTEPSGDSRFLEKKNMWLLLLAVVGMLVPGGLFVYWLANDYSSLSAALCDRLALAYFVDLLMSTFVLAYLFARKPLGPVKWPWFIAMSLLGTLAFSIPLFIWLNWRYAPAPKPSFTSWWRAV